MTQGPTQGLFGGVQWRKWTAQPILTNIFLPLFAALDVTTCLRKRRRSETGEESVQLASLSPEDWEGLTVIVKSGRYANTSATVKITERSLNPVNFFMLVYLIPLNNTVATTILLHFLCLHKITYFHYFSNFLFAVFSHLFIYWNPIRMKVVSTGNGWVQLMTLDGDMFAKRAHQLEIRAGEASVRYRVF